MNSVVAPAIVGLIVGATFMYRIRVQQLQQIERWERMEATLLEVREYVKVLIALQRNQEADRAPVFTLTNKRLTQIAPAVRLDNKRLPIK